MSETLEVLVKLAERKVEEAQRALVRTREEIKFLQEEQVRLEQEVAVAFVTAVGEEDVLAMQAAGAFQERMRRKCAELKAEEEAAKRRQSGEEAALQGFFAEQKRYELLLEKKRLVEKKERARKAQYALDEVGQRRR